RSRPAFQVPEQRGRNAVALPAIVDRQAEFKRRTRFMEGIARLGHDGLETIDHRGGDDSETFALADLEEIVQQALRQFADRAEEPVVAGAGRERTEIMLELVGVTRFDEADAERLALPGAQH